MLIVPGQKSFAFGCDGDLIEINPLGQQQAQTSSTNGNADNHDIELDDTFLASGSMLNVDLNPSYSDINIKNSIDTKSKTSNGRHEKRLAKQLSIDDSAQDLNSPENHYLPDDDSYSRSCENSLEATSFEVPEMKREVAYDDRSRTRVDSSDDERMSRNSPRRASDGTCVTERTLGRLNREEGRRFSDGVLRLTSSLLNRRRSLKRQSRISDAEAVQYCESDVCSIRQIENNDESPEIVEDSKLNVDETEGRNHRSDRLLKTPDSVEHTESLTKKLATIDIEESQETNGTTSAHSELQDGGEPRPRKVKKRKGLAAIRDMHGPIMSVRMEPGF